MANQIEGKVVAIDSHGNLVTDITREMLAGAPTDETLTIHCDGHETHSLFATHDEQPPMTLVAVLGSNDPLEIVIVDDSAKIMLGVEVGAEVKVSW